jgi:beta-glucosidase
MPFVQAKIVKANKRKVVHTLMNWEVYPPSIYKALMRLNSYPSIKEILVTENGAAFADEVVNNEVDDKERLIYLQDHIGQVLQAQKEGVNVKGYFVWTLMDNFEWAEGFHPRFGLIHVDFATQKRIIKSSGKWYSRLLADQHI